MVPPNEPIETYTYRSGHKVPLLKRADQYVVRALPDRLREMGIPEAEQTSSGSSRVTTPPVALPVLQSASTCGGWVERSGC
jgi:hypothetical protein